LLHGTQAAVFKLDHLRSVHAAGHHQGFFLFLFSMFADLACGFLQPCPHAAPLVCQFVGIKRLVSW
jgi:hypothetical protein